MHTLLKNKTTLVTGVSSGIGREIAQLLGQRGARVFGTVRNPQSASPIPGVEIVRMDVTDDSSVNEAVQNIVQKAGPIQHLVNSAGYSFMGALEETSVTEARQQFETNLFGVLRVTNAILPECGSKALDESSTSVRCWFFARAVLGNLRSEQTCRGRIDRDAGPRG